jgi:hypothetical protein
MKILDIDAGIGLADGVKIYNRIRVDEGRGEGGEFFVRTILSEEEGQLIKESMKTPKDLLLAAFRLTSYSGEMVEEFKGGP